MNSHSATLNQMWVKEDEWIDTLQWQEEDAREEFENLRIPLDKRGADLMYSVIAPEPKFQAGLIYQAATIMHAAGMNWTMPSMPGWDNSNMAMFTGDNEISGRIARTFFEAAADLGVKRIVMGECGHAFRSIYDVGNRWVSWAMPPFEVVHALEFYHELLTGGRITIGEKYAKKVTLHDPCNVSRGRGLHDMAREVVKMTCADFVEMTPNREHNYCCGAGGGVINCGPPYKGERMVNNRVKAEQLAATGAEVLIAPCHNCHSGLEDIIHHYDLNMEIKFLGDIIYETMEKKVYEPENKMKSRMRVSVIILTMVMLCLGILTLGLCQEDDGPVRMDTNASAFDHLRRPAALFDHDAHNETAGIEDCAVCHHVWEDGKLVADESSEDTPCADCHSVEAGPDNSVSLANAFHTQCRSCHVDRGSGPLLCGQCHKK